MTEYESGDYDLAEENMVDGVRTHASRACEKGIKMRMPSARTTTASVLGSCGAVGTAGTGLGWELEVRFMLDGVRHFYR